MTTNFEPTWWPVLAESNPHGEGAGLVLDLMVILATAAAVATIFRRLKLETIPGYIIAGAMVGPHALGLIKDPENITQISGLATILLMFGIGLMLEVDALRSGMVPILVIGTASTVAFTAVAWPGAMLLGGWSAPVALTVAMAWAMSSTAVALRIMYDRRELRQIHGRICLGVAIVQDLAAVIVLAVLPPIASWAGAGMEGAVGAVGKDSGLSAPVRLVGSAALGIGGVSALLVAGRVVLPRVLREVVKDGQGSSELVLIVSSAIALAAALATGYLGFSPELGAFLAGFMLGFTPFRHQLAGQVAPVRDLLMAVFLTSVGLAIDGRILLENWWQIGLGVAGLMVLKGVVLAAASWAAGATGAVSTLVGFYLFNAGEFALVILGAAGEQGILSPGVSAVAVSIAVISLVLTPLLVGVAHRVSGRAGRIAPAPWLRVSALRDLHGPAGGGAGGGGGVGGVGGGGVGAEASPFGRVIIAGFGPIGANLAERFRRLGVPHTIIELNPATVRRQTRLGRSIIYGDVTNPEVLESAGVREADAIILTIPDEEAMLRACEVIRNLSPRIFIAVRTNFLSRAIMARDKGADHVTVEEMETAQAMEREVVAAIRDRAGERAATAAPSPPPAEPQAAAT
ncbi:MAG: cation:proton antiporter [Phycisphaerales bacterium]|nr:cation:proton antiporter [Phycisphaerales bacterium]